MNQVVATNNYRPIEDPVWKVLVPEEAVNRGLDYLANKIANCVRRSKKPVVLAVVPTGGLDTGMELVRRVRNRLTTLKHMQKFRWGIIDARSYGKGEKSGYLAFNQDGLGSIEDCNIIIIDDIFDSGQTVEFLKNYLIHCRKAAQVRICTLLEKKGQKKPGVKVDPDYVAIVLLVNTFVAGCGLDGGERFEYTRSYPEIRYNINKGSLPEAPWYVENCG